MAEAAHVGEQCHLVVFKPPRVMEDKPGEVLALSLN